MSETSRYDVIIAGGGPAGATAGYLLSRAGLRVLIIDKSTFPRIKLCAGLITYKTIKLLERVFGESAASLKEKGIINYESGGYEIYCRERLITRRNTAVPFRFIDREVYDHFLLKKAREAGADVIEGDGIGLRSLDILNSSVRTQSGRQYASDFIIGADGVNSRIRRSFLIDLFGREDWSGTLASAHEIFISRNAAGRQFEHPALFFDYIEWGYAWVFPNRERLKIGMCALKKRNRKDVLTSFRRFLSAICAGGTGEERIHSYVLPYGSFLPTPVFRNILLVGDAAGFADPLLGEGIYYAQRSAELASRSILESRDTLRRPASDVQKKTAACYLELLQKEIYTELIYAGKIRDILFTCFSRGRYLPLKIMLKVLGDMPAETVHGMRSYKWMKKQTGH